MKITLDDEEIDALVDFHSQMREGAIESGEMEEASIRWHRIGQLRALQKRAHSSEVTPILD